MKKNNRLNFGWLVITLGLVAAIGFGLGPALAQDSHEQVGEEVTGDGPVITLPYEDGAEFEEAFGDKTQATWMTAWDFETDRSADTWTYAGTNFMERYTITGDGFWNAPVRLPSGCRVTAIYYYYYRTAGSVSMSFYRANSSTSSSTLFNTSYSGPLSGHLVTSAGLNVRIANGTGYYFVRFILGTGSSKRLWGVRILWERDQGPAGSQIFFDVPPSNIFYQSINNMYRSGITQGCPFPNYCPNQFVTRGQMAAFLARALGLYWAYPNY
jgi:hypothetical protein